MKNAVLLLGLLVMVVFAWGSSGVASGAVQCADLSISYAPAVVHGGSLMDYDLVVHNCSAQQEAIDVQITPSGPCGFPHPTSNTYTLGADEGVDQQARVVAPYCAGQYEVQATAYVAETDIATSSASFTVTPPIVVHVWRVNLDGDAHIERARLVKASNAQFTKHWLEIADVVNGSRVVTRVSPRLDFLSRRAVTIGDLNARPRRKEISYVGYDGGTAGAPTYAGIRGWNGHSTIVFWSYHPPYRVRIHNGRRYHYDGASIVLAQLRSARDPAWEINLHQAEITGNAPLCCPQYEFIRHYRYRRSTRTWVVYEQHWRKL